MTYTEYGRTLINNEQALIVLPKRWKWDGAGKLVLWCHGVGGNTLEARRVDGGRIHTMIIIDRLVEELGVGVVSAHFGGNQWGNDVAMSRIDGVLEHAEQHVGADTSKIGLWGHSMGHLNFMNWTQRNRSRVACVMSAMGTPDLDYSYSRESNTAGIDRAYGGEFTPTDSAERNPSINTSQKFNGLPWLGFYGTTDTACPVSYGEKLAEGIGSTARLEVVPGGHSYGTVGEYDQGLIVDHFGTHLL